jgi:nucleolar protein 4
VWFIAKKDAEKAMDSVNGKSISRLGDKGKGKQKGVEKGEERVVAVDWALSKDKWEEMQKGQGAGGEVEKDEEFLDKQDEGEESGDEAGDVEMKDGSTEDDVETQIAEEDEGESEDEDEGEDNEDEPVKPKLPTVDVGSTLFIRNLPFETEEHELNAL